MRGRKLAVVLIAAGLAGLGGCGGRAGEENEAGIEPAGEAAQAPAGSTECTGTLDGVASGAFTCTAVANFYPSGSPMVEGRANSIVTILSNPYDATHTRPAGVVDLGMNIEIAGEPAPRTFKLGNGIVDASGTMSLDSGASYDRVRDLTLVLSSVSFVSEEEIEGIGVNRSYVLDGEVEYTLTGTDGQEVRVKATF
jgi:hypothetical protein